MSETALRVRLYGSPILRRKAVAVKHITAVHRDVLSQMSRLMYDEAGIGLAAPQVGISEAMIVVDIGSGLFKLINPRIVSKSGSHTMEEGCLSVPGVCIKVKRAKKVVIKALDDNSKQITIEAQDLLACVFQHEIDHLKGKLIIDYASFLDKLTLKRKLEEIKKRAKDEGLSEPETKSCNLQL